MEAGGGCCRGSGFEKKRPIVSEGGKGKPKKVDNRTREADGGPMPSRHASQENPY